MMDKNLHDDIGNFFYDGIEPLGQPPRKQVWENIEQQLDKKYAARYKQKFIALRRVAMVLIFLLISLTLFTVFHFNGMKNNKTASSNDSNKNRPSANHTAQNGNHNNMPDTVLISKSNKKFIGQDFEKDETAKALNKERAKTVSLTNVESTGEYKAAFSLAGSSKQNEFHFRQNNVEPVDLLYLRKTGNNYKANSIKLPEHFFPVISIKDSSTVIAGNKPDLKKNKNKDTLHNRFSLMAYAAPQFAGYNLEADEINGYDSKQDIANREKPDISFSIGILAGYDMNKHLTLQSGIAFSLLNINIAASKIYAEKTNAGNIKYRYNTSSGYGYILPSFSQSPAVGDSLLATRADHTMQFITVPVTVKYRVDNKRFSFYAGAGVTVNFLTKAIVNTEVVDAQNHEKESIVKLQGLKKVSYSLLLAPELRYKLSNKWSLSAIPYFKYALSPINKGNLVKTYPYNIGLGIGVVHKF